MPRRNARQPEAPEGAVAYGALQHAIGYLIHLAELANMQGFSRAFAGTGVTPARFTALELIACNPGIRPSTLATAMAVERSNLVAVIRFLEARGWVAAGAGSNRREKSLTLTAAGEAALAGLRLRLRAHDAALANGCAPQERRQLARLLARIVGARAG
ncbi:MAG: MarR family transcriptional regulator [Lautropia sp.]|nr:MAG: MarR family transcriptional regulator [Pseudomonadota bacterium]MBC6959125.1 MarR family transcriptional regulator [Lautropia sp.]MCL4702359.1 MarR family transcriptional regulator [Burkholderiaceae bacterium]MDL1906387.1 MarR family transcriptional regulator [Betaproteobacteria bacterium PRO1]RIK90187.1 MAG: MarR family transcriptional regulator [Burkholderiales bacterium]